MDGGVSLAAGAEGRGPAAMEYAADACVAPMAALRDGRWKYTACPADPEQLFDLEDAPQELRDRAGDPAHAGTLARLRALAAERWDLARYDAEVRASQAQRLVVCDALRQGGYCPWDVQPLRDASERFMRNHMDLNIVEERQRFPRGE